MSGKEGRPLCLSFKKGSCLKDKFFSDYWHHPVLRLSKNRYEWSLRPHQQIWPSLTKKFEHDRTKQSRDKHSVQVPDVEKNHAAYLERHKPTGPEDSPLVSPRHGARFPNCALQSQRYTTRCTARKKRQTLSTPDFSNLSEDWWTCQEDLARHKTWKLHNEVHKMKEAYVDVHRTKFSKEYFHMEKENTSKAKPIVKSKNRMFIVDSGSSLHMKGEVLSIRRKRKLFDRQ